MQQSRLSGETMRVVTLLLPVSVFSPGAWLEMYLAGDGGYDNGKSDGQLHLCFYILAPIEEIASSAFAGE
jgi:hypothetical protein